jgi:protein ImuB
MTRLEVEGLGEVELLARSAEVELASRAVLQECCAGFSPRLEEIGDGMACVCVLDIAGTERLFGTPNEVAARLRTALAGVGLRVSVAVSRNFDVARMKAAWTRGVTVIGAGEEAAALARLPLAALELAEQQAATFALWGIRTLGELAELPEVELITRMGQVARRWRSLAMGVAEHSFQAVEPAFALQEFCDFETPVEDMESLLFVAGRMVECLTGRAGARALALGELTVAMELAGGRVHRLTVRPAVATIDRKFLLKLLQLELAAHPPGAAVRVLRMGAEPGYAGKVQLGLFAPQTPEPSRLDVTLARLRAIVGEGRVGVPVLEDTHRPGSFHMESFAVGQEAGEAEPQSIRTALRRLRPAKQVRVVVRGEQPAIFHDGWRSYVVTEAFGPWRSNGCWWALDGWDAEEWDVLAAAAGGELLACLLVFDHRAKAWQLEAMYD